MNIKCISLYIILCLAFFKPAAHGQVKSQSYCELYFRYSYNNSTKVKFDGGVAKIDLKAAEDNLPKKDSLLIEKTRKVENLKTLSACFTYLSSLGWNYKVSFPTPPDALPAIRFIFSRDNTDD
ncbi:hypothetical protein GS399_20045 [Pedobacter sp. HMF7647]|uniref:Uncharacterized protein n=1 Tax=Hufsiella arboris TaxID=2695275 RepID=A0A7K1YF89_9SPHI|nr:hypothetical protein [Hufsiella arboris]MXV53265.1 hypothetical protein [Hufsiella arboris]